MGPLKGGQQGGHWGKRLALRIEAGGRDAHSQKTE